MVSLSNHEAVLATAETGETAVAHPEENFATRLTNSTH